MVDYTRGTGTSGTLIIRDNGSTVTFLIKNDQGATFTNGASWSGTVNGVHVGGTFSISGAQTVQVGAWAVAKSSSVSFGIGATGTQGLGGPTSFSAEISRPLPAAPGQLMVARASDTQHTLNWSRMSTYTSVIVQRRTNGGSLQQIGAPSGNAYTFTDKSTVANKKYEYRVAGRAASGQSGWSNTATVYTTPAVPTGVKAVRSGNGIVVSASGVAPYATSFDVRDGSKVVGSGVSLPWKHANPDPATPHTYTVRAKVGSLASGYSAASNTVQLLTPPNAPTALAPNGKIRGDGESVRFSWTHNPVDSSVQSTFELRYRPTGTKAWVTRTGTKDAFLNIILDVGAFEWQVRTKGSHPDFSQWSATATVTVIDRPGVAIEQPDTVWAASRVPVVWSWYQAQSRPQSAWEAELINGVGDRVEAKDGTGGVSTVTFDTRVGEGEWTVQVRAATGDVWSEWGVSTFTVAFTPPAPPVIAGEWDEEAGVVQLEVAPGAGAGFEVTTSVIIERSIDGGETWELVVEVVGVESVVLDGESLSFGDTQYRATALTVEGATTSTQFVVVARSSSMWLSGGEAFGITGRLPYDPSVKVDVGRQRALKQYAGRSRPVALTGEAMSRVFAVSGTTSDRDDATAHVDRLSAIAQADRALFLFRDPDGRRVYGGIEAIQLTRQTSIPHPDGWEGIWAYGFTLTEATA